MAGGSIRRLPTIVLALIVPVIAVAAVLITLNATSDDTSSASSSGGSGSGAAVSIKNFQFSPNPILVKAGSTLTVTNHDGTTHTLTANDKSFSTGNLDGGARATIKIGAPAKYAYHCEIHNYMTGRIEAR
jgi:plastocyanin